MQDYSVSLGLSLAEVDMKGAREGRDASPPFLYQVTAPV